MSDVSKTTRDHDVIRQWAEQRGGTPSHVTSTGSSGDVGILRIDFPGYSGEGSLEPVSWEQWFEKFDDQGLAFLYEEETTAGDRSNFNKLVSAETAAANVSGSAGASKRPARRPAAKKAPAKKAVAKQPAVKKASAKKAAPKKATAKKAAVKKAAKSAPARKAAKKALKKVAAKKAAPKKAASKKKAVKKAAGPRKALKKAAKKAPAKKTAAKKTSRRR